MEFEKLIKERYSCRKFTHQPVEKQLIDKILEAGRIAPTAKNMQPIKIYVLQSEEALKKIDTLTPCRFNAPIVLLFTYDKNEEWKSPFDEGVHSGVEDVSIVATHMMLEAKNVGLDSCWVNYFPNTKLEQLFDIPSNERSVLLLPIGYGDMEPSIKHKEKKDIDELVRYL